MENENKKISLLDRWKNKVKSDSLLSKIDKAPEGIGIPLSPGQKRLWFLQQMHPRNPFYNYSETYTFRGKLNIDVLVKSLKRVYKDHDILRTTFHINNNDIEQRIDPDASLEVKLHDLSALNSKEALTELEKIKKEDAKSYFNLTKGPLVRVSIIKLSNVEHTLQITLHHIITDKWSMRIFRDHLAGYYLELLSDKELTKRKGEIQYLDYCYWLDQKETNEEDLIYWKNKLSGIISELSLPFDFKRPLQPSFKGAASFTQDYSAALSSKLLDLSKELQTTPYNLMLSVFYLFLYRCTGQRDISIGTPLTNRDHKALEHLIGFFNDTVVLRMNIQENLSFSSFVKQVSDNTLEAFEHRDVAFDKLVKDINVERSLATNPFFQVMFLYHSKPENPWFGDDLSLNHTWFDSEVSKFDLTIYVGEDHGVLSTTFEYASDLFEASTMNRFQEYFKILLEGISIDPHQNLLDIPMLTEAEKELFSKQDDKNNPDFDHGIHQLFEKMVTKNMDQKAVTFKNLSLSYKQLNARANSVAHGILKRGIKKHAVIGLCANRSVDMIIGMLGILKAGCCYLPIDPEYPQNRIDFVLDDSETKLVLTQSELATLFDQKHVSCLHLENIDYSADISNENLPQVKGHHPAYIIYTSGSTGKPKGVRISHGNILNSTQGRLEFYEQDPKVFLLMSSISFDSSKAGIFWTLCTGGNLVISEKRMEQDIDKIATTIHNTGTTHALMLPSLYNLLLNYSDVLKLETLSTVIVAGEACSPDMCRSHFNLLPKANLYNEYGPTEATVWCIAHKIINEDLIFNNIPIGKPVANAKIYILNEAMELVPTGVIGEIYVGGPGLSDGYLNSPELTSKYFIENPFNPKEKIYKTGDLGIYKEDGTILFFGRADEQVKIRGYRVELSEIENSIKQYSREINEAVVVVESDETNVDLEDHSKENLLVLLENIEEKELNDLINSIKLLDPEQRHYILNKLT